MNELIIADKIEKQLQEPREPTIFPLTPTHRKELRTLRDDNIGSLRQRLRNIETLKREEYQKKYSKDIEKELGKHEKLASYLNKDWKQRLVQINNILQDRKKLEEKSDVKRLYLNSGWEDIAKLKDFDLKREYTLDREHKANEIARDEFEEKYKETFNSVLKKIDIIFTQYEEAINFGDLEIVKKLYYIMKTSDSFFQKISELKI